MKNTNIVSLVAVLFYSLTSLSRILQNTCFWFFCSCTDIKEILKLALNRPPNTTRVTKGGKTGNLFSQSVRWEQMSRKIKSANKVETGIRGCFFCSACTPSPFFLFHNIPCFLKKHKKVAASVLKLEKKRKKLTVLHCYYQPSRAPSDIYDVSLC